MKCKCQSLDDVFYIDQAPRGFEKKLRKIDTGDWMQLCECPVCGQLWAVDEWDKYSWQVVSRVSDRNAWNDSKRIEERKALLLRERGGTTDDECMWADCHEKQVKGVAYCLEHLWNTGARRWNLKHTDPDAAINSFRAPRFSRDSAPRSLKEKNEHSAFRKTAV